MGTEKEDDDDEDEEYKDEENLPENFAPDQTSALALHGTLAHGVAGPLARIRSAAGGSGGGGARARGGRKEGSRRRQQPVTGTRGAESREDEDAVERY